MYSMMQRSQKYFFMLALGLWAGAAMAINPYIQGDKLAPGTASEVMAQAAKKLEAGGFTVVGEYSPEGLGNHGVVIATDPAMLDVIRKQGGATIAGAGLRVGVKSDGTLTYMNPEYWYRAYFRKQYTQAQGAVKAVTGRLAKTLGSRGGVGGVEDVEDLANYRYMVGMERFDDEKNMLFTSANFDTAVKTIQDNLARGVGNTGHVYEVILPEKQIAVFGVAMNDATRGEGWWVNKIGPDNIAALPYEIYVVGNKAYAFYGRYRIALSWPSLGMGPFMRIVEAPDAILFTLTRVAGGTPGE
jgi:hypothetical protein